MPLRQATRADIPVMARIFAASIGPNPMFQFLFPHQKEQPEAWLRASKEYMWLAWYDYSSVLVVSYELSDEDISQEGSVNDRSHLLSKSTSNGARKETIAGIAQWVRVGKGWEHVHGIWGRWDPRLLLKPLLSLYYRIHRLIIPNKSETRPTADNPHPLTLWNLYQHILPLSKDLFGAPERQTRWTLQVMAVHHTYQRRGIGSELVHEGLERAKRDPEGELPVCVVSAEGKYPFYQKCGFGEVEGSVNKAGGSENLLLKAGVGGGDVMWTK